ncbi:MAG: glycine zipper 2TM domain-containing protein [Pseudomonadota bacterium]
MKQLKLAVLVLLASTSLLGCASKSGNVYTREQAQQAVHVRLGVVEHVREVTMEGTKTGAGTLAGAAVGGIAGSGVGGGKGQMVGAILGAVAGGVAGSSLEDRLTQKPALEITVKLDNGELLAIVQESDERFQAGDRVRVLSGRDATRVTH